MKIYEYEQVIGLLLDAYSAKLRALEGEEGALDLLAEWTKVFGTAEFGPDMEDGYPTIGVLAVVQERIEAWQDDEIELWEVNPPISWQGEEIPPELPKLIQES